MGECAEPCDWPVENWSWPSVTPLEHVSLKCPLHCLASCGISWVRMSQGRRHFLSYQHAGDHFESSLGTCWGSFLVMVTLGVFPDHAQDQLPCNALPITLSPTLPLPMAPVPPRHSSITAGLTWWHNSFSGFLPYWTLTFTRVGTVTYTCYPLLPAQYLVSFLLLLITHVIQGNIKFTPQRDTECRQWNSPQNLSVTR